MPMMGSGRFGSPYMQTNTPQTLEEAYAQMIASAGGPLSFSDYPNPNKATLNAQVPDPAAPPAPQQGGGGGGIGKGLLKFLGAFAGNLGDNLTGNPVYSNAMKGRQELELAGKKRQQDMEDWYLKQQIEASMRPPPEPPSDVRLYEWLKGQPDTVQQEFKQLLPTLRPQQFTPPAPISMKRGDVYDPAGTGGAGTELPFANTPEEAAQKFPGQKVRTPFGIYEVPGGPSLNSSGGFR